MPVTKEDKILIKILFMLEGYNAKQLVRELPSKGWNVGSIDNFCKNYAGYCVNGPS